MNTNSSKRNSVQYRTGTISAKDARICYDPEFNAIVVSHIDKCEPMSSKRLSYSTGACYAKWRENCQNEKDAIIILLKQYYTFTYIWGFDPGIVEQALEDIIEWNEAWAKPELQSGEEEL